MVLAEVKIKDILISNINQNIEFLINLAPKLIIAIIFLMAVFYFEKFFSKIILRLSNKSKLPKGYSNLFLKISKVFFIFTAIIVFLHTLGFKGLAAGIFAGGGVTTVILGFAFREIGENFFAGVLLSLSRPFKIADTIKTSDVEGVVKSIEIRHTHIRSNDGKDIYVPSSQIYKNTLANYTQDGFMRYSFIIGVDYSSNLHQVCDIIDVNLGKISGILKNPESGCIVGNLLPGYIEINVYLWININKDRPIKEIKKEAVNAIKDELISKNIILSNNTSSNHEVNVNNIVKN